MPETRHFCPHCEETVSLSTFHRHKQLYYDENHHKWVKASEFAQDSEVEDLEDEEIYYDFNDDYISSVEEHTDSEDDFDERLEEQLHDYVEEDIVLIERPHISNIEEADIDNGEFWDDQEDFDIDGDIYSGNCTRKDSASGEDNQLPPRIPSVNEEEQEFQTAMSIAHLFSIIVAKFSYRYNITANALSAFLKLIRLFLSVIATVSQSISLIYSLIPSSLYHLKSALHLNENDFVKYVVCPSCHSLYRLENCFTVTAGKKEPKTCSYVAYPRHPHSQRRLPCGTRLLSEVKLKSGNSKFYPRKFYCYKPISESLLSLCKREGFLASCEVWRLRNIPDGMLCDIYDGQVWKDFHYIGGAPFLAVPHNLALILNIDWFRPYKHTPYSVGAIYIVVANLPRSKRFRKENLLLVGLVPGPGEPPIHMNTYLDPLVDELISLWDVGIQVTTPDFLQPITIKAALICSACDIPACRKVLGFYGHMSKMGCSKCTKEFKYDRVSEKILFGGFNACPMRKEEEHRQQAYEAMKKNTQSAQEKIEKKYGSRYSSMMKLSYFDSVRFHVVDPMHNLFLGTAKYMVKKLWLNEDNPAISKPLQSKIQEKIDKCQIPSSIGRIPHKVASAFSSFTADQWKSWTNIFSLYALHGILDDEDYKCWQLFVQACQILTTPTITLEAAEKGHRLLLEFCIKFEFIYKSHRVTPNMHLHTHLLNCIKDYGPVYSFWLFSFERYNGLLGSFRTNQRSVEVQLMRKFITDTQIQDLSFSNELISESEMDFLVPTSPVGTLSEAISEHNSQYLEIAMASTQPLSPSFTRYWTFTSVYELGGIKSTELLGKMETDYLCRCYNVMYPDSEYTSTSISCATHKYSHIKVGDIIYGSQGTRTKRSSYILAQWCACGGTIDTATLRPAQVKHFFQHTVLVSGSLKTHIFAEVEWFKPHLSRNSLGMPVEVWCYDLFEPFGPASYLPVQRICSRFVAAIDKLSVNAEILLIVMPLQQKTYV